MTLPSRDIAVISVLSAVAFLALLTYATYRCSPSLFRRQHRARMPAALSRRRTDEDGERINPVKLDRFISNTTQASSVRTTNKSASIAAVEEVPEERL